jgi:outer membrane murein-binding lipoprotein Lpp
MFKKQRTEQEKVLTNISGIEKKYDKLSTNVNDYKTEVTRVVDDYKKEIETVKATQKEANRLNLTTTTSIDTYLGYIQQIFDNIQKYFKN